MNETDKKTDRLTPGELDDLFVEYYLDTANQTEAYRRACKAGGHEIKEQYASQYGKAMFDRLKERIGRELLAADIEDKTLGRMKLRALIKADSESVQFQAANKLASGLYPDVVIEKTESYADLDNELQTIEEQLQQGVH